MRSTLALLLVPVVIVLAIVSVLALEPVRWCVLAARPQYRPNPLLRSTTR
jgi:hypothetical protein